MPIVRGCASVRTALPPTSVGVAHGRLEAVGALVVDHLREDEDHRDLGGELAP